MAKRTYLPGLKALFEAVKLYIGRYRDRYQNNVSQFLFALADFICDLIIVFIVFVDLSSDIGGHYDPDLQPATPPYINQIIGAINKFFAALGLPYQVTGV